MTVVTGVILALGAVFLSFYLKNQQKEIAALLVVSASVLLFCIAVANTGEAIQVIRETVAESGVTVEVETLCKALGIAVLTQIAADICRGVGEASLAGQVELIGRTEIVVLSLPLVAQILSMARGLLS